MEESVKVRKGKMFWKKNQPLDVNCSVAFVGQLFITSRGWRFTTTASESYAVSDKMPYVDGNQLTWVNEHGEELCVFRA